MTVSLKDITKTFETSRGVVRVIDDLSLAIELGEFLASSVQVAVVKPPPAGLSPGLRTPMMVRGHRL